MTTPLDSSQSITTQRGLIGFFDILGYKSIIQNNHIGDVISVVKTIQDTLDQHQKYLDEFQHCCGHVMFSDSILVYVGCAESQGGHQDIGLIAEFCAGCLNDLFWAGLPVRGAWAFGEFYIDLRLGKVCLAGLPIVEAYELCNCVDLAGCVIAPSAENVLCSSGILGTSLQRPLGFIQYSVPLKNYGNHRLFMLDHYAFDRHNKRHPEVSRQIVIERFAAHNKHINVEVLSKVNNTFDFLQASKADWH